MTTTRRSLFGFLAGAPVAVAAAKEKQPEPEFFVGQIRAVHSHYETKLAPQWFGNGSFAQLGYVSESVSVTRHEQWNGTEWLPIDKPAEDRT